MPSMDPHAFWVRCCSYVLPASCICFVVGFCCQCRAKNGTKCPKDHQQLLYIIYSNFPCWRSLMCVSLSLSSARVLCGAGLSNGTVDAAQQHDRTGALHTPRIALASAGGPFVIVLALPLCSSSLSVFLSPTLFPTVHHYLHHLCHLQPSRTLREVGS